MTDLLADLGSIDIYLFDQLQRGRIRASQTVLDAGCGSGRNLAFFLRQGFEVFGLDADPAAIRGVQALAARLAPRPIPEACFRAEPLESSSFPDEIADVVVSSAVLHFARNEEHFLAMLRGSWRLLRPGGLFFCRLASSIGMTERMTPLGDHRFRLPDGSERYLVDEAALLDLTAKLGGALVDPIKTTVVQNARCMTTWVLTKAG